MHSEGMRRARSTLRLGLARDRSKKLPATSKPSVCSVSCHESRHVSNRKHAKNGRGCNAQDGGMTSQFPKDRNTAVDTAPASVDL